MSNSCYRTIHYGQTHTFEITVFNQGNVTAKDIQVRLYT
ncbi:MAG: hypothetical protein IPL25_16600 [Saprospiraceae bacterium]|nr:hypothetical protein [Candidatus Vicinibacter affinis]